jgi:hypothetical protein
MRMLPELRARDPHAAARSAVMILAVCAGVVAGLTTFQQATVPPVANLVGWLVVAALTAAAAVCMLVDARRLDRLGACAVIAVGGILMVCLLNVLTRDTTAASQAFLAFPVLWAASHLRQGAVVLVTGARRCGPTASRCSSSSPRPRPAPTSSSSARCSW